MPLDISLVQVLDAHADGRAQDVHVAVPGQIVEWSSGTATVQPTVRKPLTSADGVLCFETLPQIPNVPCFIQASGGFICSMPYAAGDPVFLIFSEQSYAEWLANGTISSPKDIRRHGVGYPYAIPGPRPASKALSSLDATKMVVGKDGGEELITIGAGQLDIGVGGQPLATKADIEALKLTLASGTCSAGPVTFGVPFSPSYTTLVKAK
jgi:hypothetical protein